MTQLSPDEQTPNSCGQPKPIATGSDSTEPAASPEAANRRMSFEDMSRPLSSMPAGNTSAQAVPAGEHPNKTPSYLCERSHWHTWISLMVKGFISQQSVGPNEGR